MKVLGTLWALVLIILLTLITQIGGIAYVLARMFRYFRPTKKWGWVYFPLIYLLMWLATPFLAAPLGRVPLPYQASVERPVQAQHLFTILANRNYVCAPLRDEVYTVARIISNTDKRLVLTYLDANFPFWDGFPLLPHKSHDDGEKLDIAFFYKKGEKTTSKVPSFLGYGRCTSALKTEFNQTAHCQKKGFWQYSLLLPLAKPFVGKGYTLDEEQTTKLVKAFAKQKRIRKLFLEPHLKKRWGLEDWNKIRFQGCAAVRHDDHLHIQL